MAIHSVRELTNIVCIQADFDWTSLKTIDRHGEKRNEKRKKFSRGSKEDFNIPAPTNAYTQRKTSVRYGYK